MGLKRARKSIRSPQQQRSTESVDAILKATAQILTRSGNSKISTNAIAEKAGVSIGAVYQYFHDKEDILRTLCLRERQKDNEEMEKCLKSNSKASLQELTPALLRVALDRSSDAPIVRQIIDREAPHTKTGMKALQIQLARILCERLKSSNKAKVPVDTENRLYILVSGVESAFYAAIEKYGEKLDKEMLIEETAAMVSTFLSRL